MCLMYRLLHGEGLNFMCHRHGCVQSGWKRLEYVYIREGSGKT